MAILAAAIWACAMVHEPYTPRQTARLPATPARTGDGRRGPRRRKRRPDITAAIPRYGYAEHPVSVVTVGSRKKGRSQRTGTSRTSHRNAGHDAFLAGYGAAQAVPGPLFTFAAYLGAVASAGPGGIAGAAMALSAVFLPGFLLVVGAIPFWDRFRRMAGIQGLMRGANAAVVGILGAALYDPVFTTAVTDPRRFALALACFVLLTAWKAPPWIVVLAGAGGGVLIGAH